MIYTVGHTKSYLKYFDEFKNSPEKFLKMGRRNNYQGKYYPGGCVFKTQNDAKNYLDKNNLNTYSIFGVLADWENDTEPDINEGYHSLLIDSQLVLI